MAQDHSSDAHTNAASTARRTRTVKRYRIRAASPAGWWPGGLLPLAGLLVTFLLGALLVAPRIEATVQAEVGQRLADHDFRASVDGSGQEVAVTLAAAEEQRAFVDALARSTRCDTWVGRLPCPTAVRLRLDEPPAVVTTVPALAPAVVAEDTPANVSQPPVEAEASGEIAEIAMADSARDRCDEQFAAILGESSIAFATASAAISPESDGLLSRLADVAVSCPGAIRIEGHTDSRGDAQMNMALSRARAGAVRDALIVRGIESERLIAEGFGETTPIGDNATAAGRAANRRIVITVED